MSELGEPTVRMTNVRAETMRELEHAESPYCSGHSGPDDVGIRDQAGVHMIQRVPINPSGEFSLGSIALCQIGSREPKRRPA
jgi:hypothetical protein